MTHPPSFREKTAWITLLILLLVYLPYFARILSLAQRGALNFAAVFSLFIPALIFQIVLAIIAAIAISIRARIDPKDERDVAIEGKAFRGAYVVLTFGVCLAALFAVAVGLGQNLVEEATAHGSETTQFIRGIRTYFTPAAATQILLFCLVLAEATKYATQIFCYRRGS